MLGCQLAGADAELGSGSELVLGGLGGTSLAAQAYQPNGELSFTVDFLCLVAALLILFARSLLAGAQQGAAEWARGNPRWVGTRDSSDAGVPANGVLWMSYAVPKDAARQPATTALRGLMHMTSSF